MKISFYKILNSMWLAKETTILDVEGLWRVLDIHSQSNSMIFCMLEKIQIGEAWQMPLSFLI